MCLPWDESHRIVLAFSFISSTYRADLWEYITTHKCPVNFIPIPWKSKKSLVLEVILLGGDLNSRLRHPQKSGREGAHESWEDVVRAIDGLHALACMPWTSFRRIVDRHGGEVRTHTFPCGDQFRAMAFAQLTWRESLWDVEVCLAANPARLYAMGIRQAVKRSTLADANERRDWRIWAEVAELLIQRARKLYFDDGFGLDLDNTVYALDSTTIDLCLSLFDWAPFRSTKAAIKLHTLLDLCGSIPTFIHISDGKMHDVRVLDMLPIEPGAFYVMDRGYLDF